MHIAARLARVVVVLAGFAAPGMAPGAPEREIPVYPNARLVLERDAGDELLCCDFVTRDAYEKVLAFYESAFKTKPLEPRALAARYPHMKANVDEMLRQMPPQMRIRFFVLSEVIVGGKPAAELFEVVSTPEGVKFNILAGQLGAKDAHFAAQWSESRGRPAVSAPPGPPADPRALAAALPPTPAGFTREDESPPGGGPAAAEATFRRLLRKEGDTSIYATINVAIEDARDNAQMRRSASTAEAREERAVKVLGRYPGKEAAVRNTSGYESCEKSFVVADRYIVAVRCEHTRDMALVDRIIGSMKLQALAR